MFGRKRRVNYNPGGVSVTHIHSASHHTTPRHAPRSAGLMSRLRPRRNPRPVAAPVATRHHATHSKPVFGRKTRTHAPRHHHTSTTTVVPARKASLGDKVSGAMLKLRGSLSGRPGQKAAGTRRMHGTDGRAPRRYY